MLKRKGGILFPLKNEKLTPALCDQVTQCLGSLTFSLIIRQTPMTFPPQEVKELWIPHNRMRL